MAKRSLKATVPVKKDTSKKSSLDTNNMKNINDVINKSQTTPTADSNKINELVEARIKTILSPILGPLMEKIAYMDGKIEGLQSKSVIAGIKLITPSKVDSILRKMYDLPVQAGSKKLVALVEERVKDPEHAYFIIRHQRDKKLVDTYYSILSEDSLPTEPKEDS